MSTINSKNVQVGTSSTAAENFTLYQPATPDGTVRLGVGNSGATTGDVVTVNSSGVTVTGSLTATSLSGALGAATATSLTVNGNNISAVNSLGFRNRIINGDCRIAQRGTAAITQTGAFQFPVDRFIIYGDPTSKFTGQQNAGSVTPPVGFTNYLGITSSSAYSVTTNDVFITGQTIEGNNVADLAWGTANAQTVTLSFWVRSSLTGTFGGSLRNGTGNRSYPFSYTISAANTWEYKTVTVPGDTSGTWATDNSAGIQVWFGLGVGSASSGTAGAWAGASRFSATGAVSVVGTNGATFYITGVQLEAGTVASPFERRDYGRELIMCQRYYEKSYNVETAPATSTGVGGLYFITGNATGNLGGKVPFAVSKRATPTVTIYTNDGAPAGSISTDFLGEVTANVLSQGQSGFSVYVAAGGSSAGAIYGHYVATAEL